MAKQQYIGTIGTSKLAPSGFSFRHFPGICEAESENEAIGIFYNMGLKKFPLSEGWDPPTIGVLTLKELQNKLKKGDDDGSA